MVTDKEKILFILSTIVASILGIGLAVILSGCTTTVNTPERLVVKQEVVETKVLVGCKLPKIECDFTGEGFVPTEKLLDCVQKQKKALELCQEQIDSVNKD